MQNEKATEVIETAINKTAEMNPQETDGEWLEVVTVESGPYIKEWDIAECWHWDEWPDREDTLPEHHQVRCGDRRRSRARRSDGEHIAIQCKSRQLDDEVRGSSIQQ